MTKVFSSETPGIIVANIASLLCATCLRSLNADTEDERGGMSLLFITRLALNELVALPAFEPDWYPPHVIEVMDGLDIARPAGPTHPEAKTV